ncbi:glycosyltransferase [Enteractinococcus helveticum]|uniref:Mannosyltransferase n=1 Tax=Enteractinococcus helveticum TaxID=1837282 RepID=A0A1B7LV09_9MICC|nr:glycosyltransferase [Enteractinococcus helveticum]OAV51825.1 mannosyltransferase [Enteractinococcus helveticum]
MRFFMDGRYIRTDYHDGISRFSHSLIHAVAQQLRPTVVIHDPKQRELLPEAVDVVMMHDPTSLLEPLAAYKLNAFEPDVVFSPMQTLGSAGRKFGLILTLHDLIYYQHRTPPRDLPQIVRGLWYLYHLSYTPQRLLLNGADAVATVSRTSQRLIRKHHLTKKPVHVISNAPQPVAAVRDPRVPRNKSLVYMGSFMEYKNVEPLVQSLRYLPDYQLHLCSPISPQRRAELIEMTTRHGGAESQLNFHNGITDHDYREILRQSTALVTVSRSEGYGLPVAEAMAEGTPVVLSNLEIFQEIGGVEHPGALFVDLADSDLPRQIADRVLLLEDDERFAAASMAATQQAQKFCWDDSATALLTLAEDIYRRRALGSH